MLQVEKENPKMPKEKLNEIINALKEECDKKKIEMEESFKKLETLLLENYDLVFSQFAIEPIFLPVTVNIKIECENIVLEKLLLKSDETLNDLRNLVKKKLEEMKNPLLEDFNERNLFILQKNFSNEKDQNIILTEKTPFANFKIEQGSLILIRGNLKLECNKPLVCFITEFDPNIKKKVNYFTCKTCNLNWVCESCSLSCHQGHTIQTHILNHTVNLFFLSKLN